MTNTPTSDPIFEARGAAFAELGHLEQSVAEYERAIALAPDKVRVRRDLVTLLAAGDANKYAETCTRWWNYFQAADLSEEFRRGANLIVGSAFLIASNNIPANVLVELTSEQIFAQESLDPWRRLHHGRALYRSGRFSAAIAELGNTCESMKAGGGQIAELYIGGMWLSVALHGAGRFVEGKKVYSECLQEWKSYLRRPEAEKENIPNWADRLIFEVAWKEARGLFNEPL